MHEVLEKRKHRFHACKIFVVRKSGKKKILCDLFIFFSFFAPEAEKRKEREDEFCKSSFFANDKDNKSKTSGKQSLTSQALEEKKEEGKLHKRK